jgi:sarcosine oxidase
VLCLDAAAFGVPRPAVLDHLLAIGHAFVLVENGTVVGYAIERAFGLGSVVGPVVATTEPDAIALSNAAARAGFLRVDRASKAANFGRHLTACGLTPASESPAMLRGDWPAHLRARQPRPGLGDSDMHRIIIIGRGLVGSAAGRHLWALTDGVAVLGPDEPADRAAHTGVFASHYDEGRITRVVDRDPAWAVTAKRSIDRYADLEARSGIRFFTNAGYLGIGPARSEYLDRSEAMARTFGADTTRLDAAGIAARFPFLAVPDGAEGLYKGGRAGYVSPRVMVRAQTEVARQQGALIIADEATSVRATADGVEIDTGRGGTLRAERVLVAIGAFTNACGLLPIDLKLRVFGRTVVLAHIDDGLLAELGGMPAVIDAESGAYILPPIRYPDGCHYLKIGIGSTADPELRSLPDLIAWFKSVGSADNRRDFQAFLTRLIPTLDRCRHWHTDTCAVTWTATSLPYIDHALDDRLAVAVVCNGKGAKSSHDWGWLAARLAAGLEWDHPVRRERLRLPAEIR